MYTLSRREESYIGKKSIKNLGVKGKRKNDI